MSRTIIGLLIGLALGLAIAIDGFSGFLVTAAAGAVGFVVGKILDGELDVSSLVSGGANRRGR